MVVSITNQKGGVGKTTTAISISSCLARQGKKVLAIDSDPQGNLTRILLPDGQEVDPKKSILNAIIDRKDLVPIKSKIDNLYIITSHIFLSSADMQLAGAMDRRDSRLKKQLDKIKYDFDYVFIDCPPSLSLVSINAFTASDYLLIPVSPELFGLDALKQILATFTQVKEEYNEKLEVLGLFLTATDRFSATASAIKILDKSPYNSFFIKAANREGELTPLVIPRNNSISKAYFLKQDIFEFEPSSLAAQAYQKLADILFLNIKYRRNGQKI